ncbi:sulfotransferase family protein [Frateuria sp.]|uniref:tetratricopeptide repeat-containing sulfotransferase family protein n=1 Tax=Frateuria sp. TaxID=2211372 RepID=UPI00184DAC11|nr:sulfotransferase family protein [Frateuria sp.]NUR21441.1 tetratricopeptide repeat protein [Frateuria sp.]
MAQRLDGLSERAAQGVAAAARALDAGRPDEAIGQLAPALAAHPMHPEVLRMHAGALGQHGRHGEALELMRRALALRPDDPAYHNTFGTLLGQAGDYDGAVAALRRACELQPDLAIGWYNLGVMLTRCVRNEEAADALQRSVAIEPGHMEARALLADMLRMRGRVAEAAAEYRRVLAEQPWSGMAWWGLADLKTSRMDESDIAAMHAALRDPRGNDDDRIAIGFALAKAMDDQGRYDESLQALARANALARRRQRWNAPGYSTAIDMLAAAFSPPPAPAPDAALGHEVIFIVGLPRSGSTLTEQILASHSQVEGSGELPDLPQVLAEESRRRGQPFPRWVAAMLPADWERLGRRYLERTAHWRKERPRFTDKLPSNWLYADAIRAMLPGARIVGCRRDPLETCLSCYRQRLDNNEYSRDFGDLASFWRDCDRSLRRLAACYPDAVLLHDHEALLADPESQVRSLLDFCGLAFEAGCLRFHENAREVRSPSATQVREPLRASTVHSTRYGALLDPLRQALGLPLWHG